MEEIIRQLQAFAPEVWESALRQVYLDAAFAFSFVLLVLLGWAGFYVRQGGWDDESSRFALVLLVVLSVAATAATYYGIRNLANPHYMAYRALFPCP